jgi:hypothetical protein
VPGSKPVKSFELSENKTTMKKSAEESPEYKKVEQHIENEKRI